MKRLILLIALLLPVYAMAAAPITTKLLDKDGNDEGVTVVNLEGAMLQAMIASELENTEDAADVAKYLDAIRIITCEKNGLSAKIRKDVDNLFILFIVYLCKIFFKILKNQNYNHLSICLRKV